MKCLRLIGALLVLAVAGRRALAVEIGRTMDNDHRVQVVAYDASNVVKVVAAKGVSLLIVLNPDEKIVAHSTGMRSDCDVKHGATWCIIANPGDHLIWVKPLSRAIYTDLEVVTDKRLYSFELDAEPAPLVEAAAPAYRLVFVYPQDIAQAALLKSQAAAQAAREKLAQSVKAAQEREAELAPFTEPHIFRRANTDYYVAENAGSDDIRPTEVFDDGRFEYLKFGSGKSVPAVFDVGPQGHEAQVNWFWKEGTTYMVLSRLYQHIILRKDNMQVGIWNKDYHGTGSAPIGDSTAPGVYRVVKP